MGVGGAREEIVVGVIAIVAIIAVFVVMATVEFVDCPVCKNVESERNLCDACGRDGKVTLLQYITIVITKGFRLR